MTADGSAVAVILSFVIDGDAKEIVFLCDQLRKIADKDVVATVLAAKSESLHMLGEVADADVDFDILVTPSASNKRARSICAQVSSPDMSRLRRFSAETHA